jgi:5-formyltetrahydrofolate cyclo-ligase
MDLVVTPDRAIEAGTSEKPGGVDWGVLPDSRLAEIPVLRGLR